MNPFILAACGVVAIAAGAAAFGAIAEAELGAELGALASRFGVKSAGGPSQLLGVLDAVAPGESDKLKTAAVLTAVGGAAAGVIVYAVLREVLA